MKHFLAILAFAPLLGIAACATGNGTLDTPVLDRYRPVAIAGVEVAAIRYIGESQVKAKAALLAAETIDLLLEDAENGVLISELNQVILDVFIPANRLAPEEAVLIRTTLQLVTEDLANLAGIDGGLVTAEVADRVRLYTAAVKRQANRVLGVEPETTAEVAAE